MDVLWTLFFLALSSVVAAVHSPDMEIPRICEPIRVDICGGIGYNVTGMPNLVGHEIQRDAQLQVQTFAPLIQYGCSSRLRFFLCSVYVPMCTEKVPQPIGPCRPLCESVKGLCEPVLLEFGFQWPAALNCSQFPTVNNEKHMCMEGPQDEEQKHVTLRERRPSRPGIRGNSHMQRPRYPPPKTTVPAIKAISRIKCKHLRSSDRYYFINTTGSCAAACQADILYSKENKDFAQVWIAVWSSLCFLSTLLTIAMFFTHSERFRYPEKLVIILSWCYFIYSVGFFIRLIGGRDNMACHQDTYYIEPLLVQGGLDNVNCTIVFTLMYFFQMAGYIWWVIITLSWFLSAGLKWDVNAMERYGTYCHLVAWLVPAAKTTIILVTRVVDADELTAICSVGNQDPESMVRFVIIPQLIYLVLGIVFLLAGSIAVLKTKKYSTKSEGAEDNLETLMTRVGVFAVLYTIPAISVLGVNIYEYSTKDQWLSATSTSKPNVEIFTLKIFMSLVVGITTGVWLYTSRAPRIRRIANATKFCMKRQDIHMHHRRLLTNSVQHKMTVV